MESHGLKATANRIVVIKALDKAKRPMTMAELEESILTIDKSGVFRALMLFKTHHLVHAIDDGGAVRYELCRSTKEDVDEDEHPHFHCEACGKIFCLRDIPMPDVKLPKGFRIRSVGCLVKGLCPECAGKR
ncbi:MAG: transcriptional repressor [Prevotella sp.]|nr:transcriptional repressor [Prevotella sp.]